MSNQRIYINANSAADGKQSDSYRTPGWLVAWLDAQYNFKCDAAAADDNHLFDSYYTANNSAINNDWLENNGDVFCNPPFSNGMKEMFLAKAFQEMQAGVTSVFVIPADPSNKCWADHIFNKATKITIINGRVKFLDPITGMESKAGIGTAIIEFKAYAEPTAVMGTVSRDKVKSLLLDRPV